MLFTDTHAHMDDYAFHRDREEILSTLKEQGLKFILTVGYDIESSENCLSLANKYNRVYAVVGVHPHEAKLLEEDSIHTLEKLIQQDKVVGIGETGLDYYRLLSNRTQQDRAFRIHLNLALTTKKPVVIHDRDAHQDIVSVLQEYKGQVNGVVHAFSGDKEMAEKVLDLGYYISVCGWITYKKSQDFRELIPYIPEDRLLVETDAPYIAPVPHRGKRNQPGYVKFTLEKLAEVRKVSFEKMCEVTTKNAETLFGINQDN